MQASGTADSLVALLRGKGPVQSNDQGVSWKPLLPVLMPALKQLPASPEGAGKISLAQLIHDLHTGVAFVGDKGEWAWVDTMALTLIFLGGSGIFMWFSKRRLRARARVNT
jgi:hypothetical protein